MQDIETDRLVEWAYRVELPKLGGGGGGVASGWSLIGGLGVIVDVNSHGVVPEFGADAEPHPDALAVARAVAAVDVSAWRARLDLRSPAVIAGLRRGWGRGEAEFDAELARLAGDGLIELDEWCRDLPRWLVSAAIGGRDCVVGWLRAAEVYRGGDPVAPVMGFEARANGALRWRLIETRPLYGADGDPAGEERVEVDGWDARGKRPRPGAWRRRTLVVPLAAHPDRGEPGEVAAAIGARLRVAALLAAWDDVASRLGGLVDHRAVPPSRFAGWRIEAAEKTPAVA